MYLKHVLIVSCLLISVIQGFAQRRLNGVYRSGSAPEKNYCLYIPSGYQEGKPVPVLMAFHPLHSTKWNAYSWRDALIDFGEQNQTVIICPDGGQDGKVDDAEDIAFSRLLLQAMLKRYQIQATCVFAFGASWGARGAIRFGLENRDLVDGLVLMSSNMHGTGTIQHVLDQALDLPCFLIHGQRDYLYQRLYPLQHELTTKGACVKTRLVSQYGHQIPPEHYTRYLGEAVQWLERVTCQKSQRFYASADQGSARIYKPEINLFKRGENIFFQLENPVLPIDEIKIYDNNNILIKVIRSPGKDGRISFNRKGVHTFVFELNNQKIFRRVMIR